MVHPKRVRHVPRVVRQQCRGLMTSRKRRPSNRVWRYQRNTTMSSPPSLRLKLTLRNYIICLKIIRHNILWHLLIICHLFILCLVLRLIKHSLLLHPIISSKTLLIHSIIMRWCQINHLGGVMICDCELSTPGLASLRLWVFGTYEFLSTLSLRALAVLAFLPLRILASLISRCCSSSSPAISLQKQNKNNINTWNNGSNLI